MKESERSRMFVVQKAKDLQTKVGSTRSRLLLLTKRYWGGRSSAILQKGIEAGIEEGRVMEETLLFSAMQEEKMTPTTIRRIWQRRKILSDSLNLNPSTAQDHLE